VMVLLHYPTIARSLLIRASVIKVLCKLWNIKWKIDSACDAAHT
jgi:hypothetical protein